MKLLFRRGMLWLIWRVAAFQGWLLKLYGEGGESERPGRERADNGHDRPFRSPHRDISPRAER